MKQLILPVFIVLTVILFWSYHALLPAENIADIIEKCACKRMFLHLSFFVIA